MPLYEYKCGDCGAVTEALRTISQKSDVMYCTRCSSINTSPLDHPSRISVGRSGSTNAPIDVVVGADADRRWRDIKDRQAIRDKVRQQTGVRDLTATGRDEYKPTPQPIIAARQEANDVLASTIAKIPDGKQATKDWIASQPTD